MKTFIKLISMILFVSALNSCTNNSNVEKDYSVLLDTVSTLKYYSSDILDQQYNEIYGTWKVIGTSGGFSGQGYKADFDYLVIKPNLIFGIIKNDFLITTGKIEIKNQTGVNLLVDFISDKNPAELNIQILNDSEKIIGIQSDTLNLIAPCCDRYNTHLKRVK